MAAFTASRTSAARWRLPRRSPASPIEKLLDLLKAPDDRVRCAGADRTVRPRYESRDRRGPAAGSRIWNATRTPQTVRIICWKPCGSFRATTWSTRTCLGRVLHSPSDKARAAAVRVCAYWQDRLPNVLDLLGAAAEDDSPLVRLMAIWAASYVPRPEAAEIVLRAQEHPDDLYLDYLAKEAMRTLGPMVERARAAHRSIAFKTEAGGALPAQET